MTLTHATDLGRAAELVRSCCAEVHTEEPKRRLVAAAEGLSDMTRIAELLQREAIAVDDLGLKRPSLDDVFLHLTGHRAEEEDDTAESEIAHETTDRAVREEAMR